MLVDFTQNDLGTIAHAHIAKGIKLNFQVISEDNYYSLGAESKNMHHWDALKQATDTHDDWGPKLKLIIKQYLAANLTTN